MLVKIFSDGTVEKYPYTLVDLKRDNSNVSFPETLTEDILNAYNVFTVKLVNKPEYNLIENNLIETTPILVDSVWTQQWEILPINPDQIEQKKVFFRNYYDGELTNYFNNKASEKGYDNRITCAMRAGYQGPYQQECIQFAQWMDTCTVQFHQILNSSLESNILPKLQDILSQLPEFIWPT